MGQYSKVEIDGRLMTVTINRPEVYNACHPMANEELVAAFDEFHANPELWVATIRTANLPRGSRLILTRRMLCPRRRSFNFRFTYTATRTTRACLAW